MFFQNKIDRIFEALRKKSLNDNRQGEEGRKIELEKNDLLAMYISALLVFLPIFLVLIALLIWSFKI